MAKTKLLQLFILSTILNNKNNSKSKAPFDKIGMRVEKDTTASNATISERFKHNSALKTFTFDEIISDPALFYKQVVRGNNLELDLNYGNSPKHLKPLKIVNVINVNGNFGSNCSGACSELTNRLLKKIAVQQKYKLNKMRQAKCPQKGNPVNIWNMGTSHNIKMCSDEDSQSNATPSITMEKVEEMIPQGECNIVWDQGKHGDDWMCKCVTGTRQSPIDLPDREQVQNQQKSLTSTILGSVPEAVQCMKEHCSKDWQTLVKLIGRFSTQEKDQVVQKHEGSQVPVTRSHFLMTQQNQKRQFKKDGFLDAQQKRNYYSNTGINVQLEGKLGTLSLYYNFAIINFDFKLLTFHTPSEHTINGKPADMEMQIIFEKSKIGNAGSLVQNQVAISILFNESHIESEFLNSLKIPSMPSTAGFKKTMDWRVDLNLLFSKQNEFKNERFYLESFFMQNGSFSTPSCEEDVLWLVYDIPVEASLDQISAIRKKLNWGVDKIGNNRKVQNNQARNIWYRNEHLEFMEEFHNVNQEFDISD